jgi:hypothetical protein
MLRFVVCVALTVEFGIFGMEKRKPPRATASLRTQKFPVARDHCESSKC